MVEHQHRKQKNVSSIPAISMFWKLFMEKPPESSGKLRKASGNFPEWRKTSALWMHLPGPPAGNIFRAIEVVVLRHLIICLEFNVLPFHSVPICEYREITKDIYAHYPPPFYKRQLNKWKVKFCRSWKNTLKSRSEGCCTVKKKEKFQGRRVSI